MDNINLDDSVSELDMPIRARPGLMAHKIFTIRELLAYDVSRLEEIPNIGHQTIQCMQFLKRYLKLKLEKQIKFEDRAKIEGEVFQRAQNVNGLYLIYWQSGFFRCSWIRLKGPEWVDAMVLDTEWKQNGIISMRREAIVMISEFQVQT